MQQTLLFTVMEKAPSDGYLQDAIFRHVEIYSSNNWSFAKISDQFCAVFGASYQDVVKELEINLEQLIALKTGNYEALEDVLKDMVDEALESLVHNKNQIPQEALSVLGMGLLFSKKKEELKENWKSIERVLYMYSSSESFIESFYKKMLLVLDFIAFFFGASKHEQALKALGSEEEIMQLLYLFEQKYVYLNAKYISLIANEIADLKMKERSEKINSYIETVLRSSTAFALTQLAHALFPQLAGSYWITCLCVPLLTTGIFDVVPKPKIA